ncbi:DUF2797 domain-containing protein [Enterovibrio norvegicus]|nr:DUF2797 domain-containing protein [Enterovibrio norvegicus]MCC4798530.1 DUF2797 domain-containing protein [Enterovibrio norvegicus]OEE43693.1 hypothetical protein A1OS_10385 [Enterovibrio norvegicus]OEF48945.1 hypothetical protein A1OW_13795 [Enterovibrio norvegicus]PMH65454.1 hypothetical protein BCU62_12730 [Enterovibrio norvegicus]PMI33783.1 hypothetical protein BCU47_08205 [Enterovibrio norvegicus]
MITGTLSKMKSALEDTVRYTLLVGENQVELTPLIGKSLTLTHTGNIYCDACGNKTNKSFSQGHCFTCMRKLARCDMCIMKPETCHFAEGTCREPEWGEQFCMTDHIVYLSNTSGLKVGITRASQIPTRWIDQGATQALPIIKVKNRHLSGLVEIALAEFVADKTNWRALLKGDNEPLDLKAEARRLLPLIDAKLYSLRIQYGFDAIDPIFHDIVTISYPVTQHPTKIVSHNFDKEPVVSGVLEGIKGQYLIFDTGVINIRKFTSYEVNVEY